jgi:hypothetical protein
MAKPVFATNDVPTAAQVNEWMVNVLWARKTVFEDVTASTVLQNDDELFVTVAANSVYKVECLLHYDGDPGGDLKIQFSAPASSTMVYFGTSVDVTGANYGADQNSSYDLTTATVGAGAIAVGTMTSWFLKGALVTSGTAGTFRLQWAQRTAFATRTRIFPGSYLDLQRVE